jgi:hypothetical protein
MKAFDQMTIEARNERPTNLTWNDNGIWRGWTYNTKKNLYRFNDVGNESLVGLWEEQWLRESND